MTEPRWISFEPVSAPGRKTAIWRVVSRRRGDVLGIVQWFGRWRQYSFFPEPNTVFNQGCLKDIAQRGRCRDCGKEVALREDGSARAHTTPDGRAYHPDSEAVAL